MQQSKPQNNSKHYRSPQLVYGLAALIATLLLGFIANRWLQWDFYWIWLVVVNVVTFVFFRYDKNQAQKEGATRVPEIILFALMLAGGVIGGAAGMLMRPHHKTHKPMFWIVLAVATALHAFLIFGR